MCEESRRLWDAAIAARTAAAGQPKSGDEAKAAAEAMKAYNRHFHPDLTTPANAE
jgi:hypothetical protein